MQKSLLRVERVLKLASQWSRATACACLGQRNQGKRVHLKKKLPNMGNQPHLTLRPLITNLHVMKKNFLPHTIGPVSHHILDSLLKWDPSRMWCDLGWRRPLEAIKPTTSWHSVNLHGQGGMGLLPYTFTHKYPQSALFVGWNGATKEASSNATTRGHSVNLWCIDHILGGWWDYHAYISTHKCHTVHVCRLKNDITTSTNRTR